MQKTTKKVKRIDNLEKEVKEHERELKAIKEAFESHNINALNTLRMQNIPKTSRLSAKPPKKLSSKEKERRDDIRRWKEVEDLNKIQQSLFKQVKGRKKIEPIDKRILTANQRFTNIDKDDIFAINLNKECDRILGNENSKQFKPNKTMSTTWRKNPSTVRATSIKKNKKSAGKKNSLYPLSAINQKIKSQSSLKKKINEIVLGDKEKDEEFLKSLDNSVKNFYMEKTKEIFDLLYEINLCRFIDVFLSEGYDLFEEFINLPRDYFDKMEKPFLTKEQQEKLYNKLSIFKNKQKSLTQENIFENNFNGRAAKTEQAFYNKNKSSIKNKIFNEKLNKKNNDNNIDSSDNRKVSETSPMIAKDELFHKNIDIEELEKQRTEEFKKAVEEWRSNANNKDSEKNSKLNDSSNKVNKESNDQISSTSSLLINSPNEIICCYNCFRPIKKENSIIKEYQNKSDIVLFLKNKNFCTLKCIKDYEKKIRTKYVCFQCNKTFDLYQGFVAHEGEKFCSSKCKYKYIEIETMLMKKGKNKNGKKGKNTLEEKSKENKNENININNDAGEKNEEKYYEGDDYDPMDDF
jgi:hypothetical protein